ncbi:DUF58 domain-containing protein [Frankia sp. CiP1_Cm_nod1]|uniref:DUF58 domain-containing protein n=1 Tax=Frankia sp. CiP1_Cm_nod1 TaxID=2897160 RepID=UPI0020255A71
MSDFLAALRGLTVRGQCFVVTGLVCCGLAVVVGEKDLLRAGLLLLTLPLCATAFVCRTRYRLACHRRLTPARVTVGAVVSVGVRIDNMSRRSSSVLLVDDDIPAHLGFRARFMLDRVEPGGARYFTYQLRPRLRGRYLIGPMAIRITDPFGLCELTRTFRSRDELVVTPPVETLPASRPGRQITIGDLRQRDRPTMGTDDFVTRPYQAGDDLRRIHWRTSARAGELMVRREESSRPASATVLLDTRSAAWAGQGPASSFEWAVSAAGSVAAHLTESGHLVDLICDGSLAAAPAAGGPRKPTRSTTALLDALAVVTTADAGPPSRAASPGPPIPGRRGLAHLAGDGILVAVLGSTEPARAGILARARPRGTLATVVLVNVATWDGNHAAAGQEATGQENLRACRAVFQRHGWTVIVAGYGDTLATLWPGGSQRSSGRSTAGSGKNNRAGRQAAGAQSTGVIHHGRPQPPQPPQPRHPEPRHVAQGSGPTQPRHPEPRHPDPSASSSQPLEWPSTVGRAAPASAAPGPATPGPATPGPATPGPATPGPATPDSAAPASAAPGPTAPGPATPDSAAVGPATTGQATAWPASSDSAIRGSAAESSATSSAAAGRPRVGRPAATWPTAADPAITSRATGGPRSFPPDTTSTAPPTTRPPTARPTALPPGPPDSARTSPLPRLSAMRERADSRPEPARPSATPRSPATRVRPEETPEDAATAGQPEAEAGLRR